MLLAHVCAAPSLPVPPALVQAADDVIVFKSNGVPPFIVPLVRFWQVCRSVTPSAMSSVPSIWTPTMQTKSVGSCHPPVPVGTLPSLMYFADAVLAANSPHAAKTSAAMRGPYQ